MKVKLDHDNAVKAETEKQVRAQSDAVLKKEIESKKETEARLQKE